MQALYHGVIDPASVLLCFSFLFLLTRFACITSVVFEWLALVVSHLLMICTEVDVRGQLPLLYAQG